MCLAALAEAVMSRGTIVRAHVHACLQVSRHTSSIAWGQPVAGASKKTGRALSQHHLSMGPWSASHQKQVQLQDWASFTSPSARQEQISLLPVTGHTRPCAQAVPCGLAAVMPGGLVVCVGELGRLNEPDGGL